MSQFSPTSMLERALENYHYSRPRSQQIEVGPSSIHTCARQVYHQIKGTFKTNTDINFLPALMGTAIHTLIEEAISSEDVFGDDFLKETEVEYEGLKGHVDLYIKSQKMVVDWKTSTKKNLTTRFFPSPNYIYQVQVYGYLLKKSMGLEVEKVSLVALARDGGLQDIIHHTVAYDEEIALAGIKWLNDIKEIVASNKTAPAPEKDARTFCRLYCSYFDETAKVGCPGAKGRMY